MTNDRKPIVVDDMADVLPALALATGLTAKDVERQLNEMKARGYTSRQMFQHFVAIARERGYTLCLVSGDHEPS